MNQIRVYRTVRRNELEPGKLVAAPDGSPLVVDEVRTRADTTHVLAYPPDRIGSGQRLGFQITRHDSAVVLPTDSEYVLVVDELLRATQGRPPVDEDGDAPGPPRGVTVTGRTAEVYVRGTRWVVEFTPGEQPDGEAPEPVADE